MTKTLFIDCKTTVASQSVGLPLGPDSYFGGGALRLKIYWGENKKRYTVYTDNNYEIFEELGGGLADQSIEDGGYSNSSHWAPTHAYASPGTYKIKVYGGVGADSNFDGGKIAFSQTSEHDNDGVASINDQRHNDATPEAFTKIRYAGGFYIHGQGDFNGFTNLIQSGKLKQINILKSDDPSSSIEDSSDSSATLFMDHTFKDCEKMKSGFSTALGRKMSDAIRSAQGTFMGSNFNGTLNKWNLNKVTSLLNFCKDAEKFKGKGLAKLFKAANLLEVLEGAFEGCIALVGKGVKKWNVANVVNVKNVFKDARVNNVNVKKWNVGNVTISTGFGITGSNAPTTPMANGTAIRHQSFLNEHFGDSTINELGIAGLNATGNATNASWESDDRTGEEILNDFTNGINSYSTVTSWASVTSSFTGIVDTRVDGDGTVATYKDGSPHGPNINYDDGGLIKKITVNDNGTVSNIAWTWHLYSDAQQGLKRAQGWEGGQDQGSQLFNTDGSVSGVNTGIYAS